MFESSGSMAFHLKGVEGIQNIAYLLPIIVYNCITVLICRDLLNDDATNKLEVWNVEDVTIIPVYSVEEVNKVKLFKYCCLYLFRSKFNKQV